MGGADRRAVQEARHMEQSAFRVEKTGAKLDKAQKKRHKQKPLKNPGAVKYTVQTVTAQSWMYVHEKVHDAEQENVGVEAGHKAELAGENAFRHGSRFIQRRVRTRPTRRVNKWEKRNSKAKADYQFRKAAQENPTLKNKAVSKALQKRRLKKRIQKQAQAAKRSAQAAKKTAVTTEKLTATMVQTAANHPMVLAVIGAILLFVVILQACMGLVATVGSGTAGAVGAASYSASDTDINSAELTYTEWETDLQIQINSMETTYPGYAAYQRNIGDIGHNPYELMAYLTAVYGDFTFPDIESDLHNLFNEQYKLTETAGTSSGGESILQITLIVKDLTGILESKMTADQLAQYQVLLATKGNRQYWNSPFSDTIDWLNDVITPYGYSVGADGVKVCNNGVDIAMPEGTEIQSGQDGTVTFAGERGDEGLMVVVDDGQGLVSKYAHCSILLVSAGQTVKAGDVIAKVGSTGNVSAPELYLEIAENNQYLDPMYFVITNDDGQGPSYGNTPGAPMGDGSYAALIAVANQQLGKPYVFGASGPDSFDCSGFVCYCLIHSGVANVGRLTAQGLYNICTPISPEEAQPGDLVFFTKTYSCPDPCSHVGIYVGGSRMIAAGNPVQYTNIAHRNKLLATAFL